MPKYGIEGGRTITVNGVPSVYINIATEPRSGRYRMVPADADDLARRIVKLLNDAEPSTEPFLQESFTLDTGKRLPKRTAGK